MSRILLSPLGGSSTQLHKIMQKCRSEQMKPMQTLIERDPMYCINSPTSMLWARMQGTYSRSVKTDLSLKHSVAMGHSILEVRILFHDTVHMRHDLNLWRKHTFFFAASGLSSSGYRIMIYNLLRIFQSARREKEREREFFILRYMFH